MYDYFIILPSLNSKFCLISDEPETLSEEGWRIPKGMPMEHRYPGNLELHMDIDHSGKMIPDFINNGLDYCLISLKLKNLLKKDPDLKIEYLLFHIINHKDRKEKDLFFIANIFNMEDCIDTKRSQLTESHLTKGDFSHIRHLYLIEDQIDPNAKLFRLKQKPETLIIRSDLRKKFEENNILGVDYIGMGEKCSIY